MAKSNPNDQVTEWLESFLQDSTDHTNPHISCFVIRKTKKRNLLEKFTTHEFQIADRMAEELRTAFVDSLRCHGFDTDTPPEIKNFSDPALMDAGECYVIQKDTFAELDGLMQTLETHDDESSMENIDDIGNAKTCCFEISMNGNSAFAFVSIDSIDLKNETQTILAEFKQDEIDTVQKNLIRISRNVFSIYIPELGQLLILESNKTTRALGFADLFRKTAHSIISKEWSVVESTAENGYLEKILSNDSVNRTLVRLHHRGGLKNEIEHYIKYNEFCDSHDVDLEPLDIKDGKIMLEKPKQLEAALYVSDNMIVEGVLDRDDYYLALRKRSIGKK